MILQTRSVAAGVGGHHRIGVGVDDRACARLRRRGESGSGRLEPGDQFRAPENDRTRHRDGSGLQHKFYPGSGDHRARRLQGIHSALRRANATPAPITLSGAGTGVVISGSDTWKGWVGGDSIYRHAWPHDWGFASVPSEWPEGVHAYLDANSIIRRQEMVFIDGRPLLQVTSVDAMNSTENSFFVSEESDQLLLNIPSEMDISLSHVEVAIRPSLLVVESRQNVTIKNVTFQHAASPLQGAAVRIAQSENVSVVDTRFVWNNSRGLGMYESGDVTIQNVSALTTGSAASPAIAYKTCES